MRTTTELANYCINAAVSEKRTGSMMASVKRAAAIAMVIGVVATSCTTHHVPASAASTADPFAGIDASKIHSHGHYTLEVRGQLFCVGGCSFSEAQVAARQYGDSPYDETKIVVDPDGRFHGELVVSFDGTGGEVKLFPEALVFKVRGCRDAVVPVSDPWPEAAIELECL